MGANSADAQDAGMAAQALVLDWFADFMAMWTKPQAVAVMQNAWTMMPAEEKEKLKAENPSAYQQIVGLLGQP